MKKKLLILFFFSFSANLFSQTGNDDSLNTYTNNSVTVTATKYQTELKKLPITVHSMNENSIGSQINSNPNVGDYVRSLPGVSVGFGNRNIPPWVHMRGTGYFIGRTLYMVDEIPLFEPRLCLAANPENMSNIEVILGPSSSLYGPNASGGAVNTVSKTGYDLQGIVIGQNYGTFSSYRPSIAIGKAFKNWNFYASFNVDDSKGYKNTDLETGLYLYNNNLPSYLNYVAIEDEKYTNTYSNASLGYKNDLNTFGVSANIHYFDEDKYGGKQNSKSDGDRVISSGKIFYTVSDVIKSTLRFGYQEIKTTSQSTKGMLKVANSAINGRYIFTAIDANNSYVYDPTITTLGEGDISNIPIDLQNDIYIFKDHIITVGGSYTIYDYSSKTIAAVTKAVSAETQYKINQQALYLQTFSSFLNNKLTLLLGLRYDGWEYKDVYDKGSTNQHPSDVDKSTVNFRGGVKYFVSDNLQVRSSYGTAFWAGSATWFFQNVSTGNTWREANSGLKPEKTNMLDIGADFESLDGSFKSSITFYTGKIVDAMTYRYDQHPTLAGVQIIRTQNSDEVKIQGLELSAEYSVLNNLIANGNFTFNKSEITESGTVKNVGHRMRNCPDHLANLGLSYLNASLFNFRFAMRYSDDRYYDDENTQLDYFHMKEYTVFDTKVWRSLNLFSGEFIVSLGIDNIFNKKYDGEFIYNAPGRYVEAGIKYKFSL